MERYKMTKAPEPTIRRLPGYLALLKKLRRNDVRVISSTKIGKYLGLEPTQIRKDLIFTGIVGKPKVGFDVKSLIMAIEEFLGWNNVTDALLVGAGALGSAMIGYEGFKNRGMNITVAFDSDESKIGRDIHSVNVFHPNKIPELVQRMRIHLGVLCVPGSAAQEMADRLVNAGIKGIWNFTPAKIRVPDDVVLQNEDLSSGMALLSTKLANKMKEAI